MKKLVSSSLLFFILFSFSCQMTQDEMTNMQIRRPLDGDYVGYPYSFKAVQLVVRRGWISSGSIYIKHNGKEKMGDITHVHQVGGVDMFDCVLPDESEYPEIHGEIEMLSITKSYMIVRFSTSGIDRKDTSDEVKLIKITGTECTGPEGDTPSNSLKGSQK